ncbi:MAG: hypothetical protein Q7S27_02275 [Nanoarchaeota archaeon]|nr:hypothetical protein [Nanoarchaeota archaeon]
MSEEEDTKTLNEKLEDIISTLDEIREAMSSIAVSLEKIASK